MSKQWAMIIDLEKCIGCHACTVACKQEHSVPKGVHRSYVVEAESGTYPKVRSVKLPKLCNQCSDAPCLNVCPTNATYRTEDGTIQVNEDKCVGCRYCIAACPYNARFINPKTNTADKCTFCLHRVEAGLMPACVSTCVAQARYFGDMNDPEFKKILDSKAHQTLRPELNTKCNVYYSDMEEVLMAPEKFNTAKGGK